MDIDRQILITGFESQRDVTMTRLAVIVAIERYDIGRDWNLNGPAQDALALIEKINEVSSSTPIHVFASLLSTSSRLYNAIASHPNVIVRDATAEHLVRFLTEELSVVQIDSFILFWGGHGVVTPDSNRRLFLASSTKRNPETIDVTRLLLFLRSSALKSATRQMLFIDACARFYEELRYPISLPAVELPAGKLRSGIEQLGLFACRLGQGAQNTEGGGVFSRALIQEFSTDIWNKGADESFLRRLEQRLHAMSQAPYLMRFSSDGESVLDYSLNGTQSHFQKYMMFLQTSLGSLYSPWLSEMTIEPSYIEVDLSPLSSGKIVGLPEPFAKPLRLSSLLSQEQSSPEWIGNRWIIKGGPGSGKTTLLRHTAYQIAKAARESENTSLPVFVSLSELQGECCDVIAFVSAKCDKELSFGIQSFLREIAEKGRLVFLLDGLDEVRTNSRDGVANSIRQLIDRYPNCTFVLSSRPIGFFRPTSGFNEASIVSLSLEQRRALVDSIVDDAVARDELEELLRDPELEDLTGAPLCLTLIAFCAREAKSVPRSRSVLFGTIIDLLLAGRHRQSHERLPEEKAMATKALLASIAEWLTRSDRLTIPWPALAVYLQENATQLFAGGSESGHSLIHAIREAAEKTSLFAPHDGQAQDWRFWHKTIQESLTASRLARDHVVDGTVIESLLNDLRSGLDQWAEPAALLAGYIADPEYLVSGLLSVNTRIGLAALSNSATYDENSFKKLLETSTDHSVSRALLTMIPSKLKPSAALRVAEWYLTQTTDGESIWKTIESVGEISRRSPSYAPRAREIAEAPFIRNPFKEDDSSCWMTTADGTREPLWALVPSGEFLMGGVDPLAHQDELPTHRVVLTSDMFVMRIPITNHLFGIFDPGYETYMWRGVPISELKFHPAVNVSWYDASAFAAWMGGRLLTEAEWEYSCRANTPGTWVSGDSDAELPAFAHFNEFSNSGKTRTVGSGRANAFGLYDLVGNVWEWCSDWSGEYSNKSQADPTGPRFGQMRVLRGGAFWNGSDRLRSAFRSSALPENRTTGTGFRVAIPRKKGNQYPSVFVDSSKPIQWPVIPKGTLVVEHSIKNPGREEVVTVIQSCSVQGLAITSSRFRSVLVGNTAALRTVRNELWPLLRKDGGQAPFRELVLKFRDGHHFHFSPGKGRYRDGQLSSWLYLGNLESSVSRNDVVRLLSKFGQVKNCELSKRDLSASSAGYCFAQMADHDSAVKAVYALDNSLWRRKRIKVNLSRSRASALSLIGAEKEG
jgi:formylglycine-generating enzyme required for sulfatase activity